MPDQPPGFREAVRPLAHWFLGPDKATRSRVLSIGLCWLVYLACCLAAHQAEHLGIVRAWLMPVLLGVVMPINMAILALVRVGWSRHREDPALMIPQNALALAAISLSYVAIRPEDRGVVFSLLTLVIVFGMYTHTPRQTLMVGGAAMGLLVLSMLVLSNLDPVYYPGRQELLRFELLAGTVPVLIYASNQLAIWRDRLRDQRAELTQALARVQHLATRDSLTGLHNRRHMQELLDASVDRLERYGERFSVALIDLDHFKRVNDALGHRSGDDVLVSFARLAQAALRDSDVVARWGGEEFLMLFPNATGDQAMVPLRRLQEALRQEPLVPGNPGLRITFSAGLATHVASASLGQTLERADAALYEAKRLGRDQVVRVEAMTAGVQAIQHNTTLTASPPREVSL
jgi:diguanylate cyclase